MEGSDGGLPAAISISTTAVSGPLLDTPLPLFDETRWAQARWGSLRDELPDGAVVLDRDQTMTPPRRWPRLDVPPGGFGAPGDPEVAPGWGENPHVVAPELTAPDGG